jgi:hypothetical protein
MKCKQKIFCTISMGLNGLHAVAGYTQKKNKTFIFLKIARYYKPGEIFRTVTVLFQKDLSGL